MVAVEPPGNRDVRNEMPLGSAAAIRRQIHSPDPIDEVLFAVRTRIGDPNRFHPMDFAGFCREIKKERVARGAGAAGQSSNVPDRKATRQPEFVLLFRHRFPVTGDAKSVA